MDIACGKQFTRKVYSAWAREILRAAKTISFIGSSWYEFAESVYRTQHHKLPGSNRTKRLRKKRRTIVLAWFGKQLNKANQ